MGNENSSPQLFPPEFIAQSATVTIRPRSLSIAANKSFRVVLEFTRPTGLDQQRIPVYSGYIYITSSIGESFHVAYAGVDTSMKNVTVTDFKTTSSYPYLSKDPSTNAPRLSINNTETFEFPAQPVYIHWRLAMGSERVRVDVLGSGRQTRVAGMNILGSIDGFPRYQQPRNEVTGCDDFMFENLDFWNGKLNNNQTVGEGCYRLLYRALKNFGNRVQKGDYEQWISPRFCVTY